MRANRRALAAELAERTADAYSYDNYGEASWRACAAMLLRRGYSDEEAEAILRSKWTRWAADSTNRKSWKYGATTSLDLARFIDGLHGDIKAQVAELVDGTF
jgi:hypothetical protein